MKRAKFPYSSCKRQMKKVTFNYDNFNIKYEADNEMQYYHEGKRGEEEANDQFDIRSVTHHHPQSLTEGEGLCFFLACV